MDDNIDYIFKKAFVNYIDISIAFMNFLIILFSLTILSKNIITSIIGFSLSGPLIIIIIYKFIRNNPLYIYYCYTLIFSSLFYLFYSLIINPILGALLIPEILYIYTFYGKNEVYSQSLIPYDNSISSYMNNIPRKTNICKLYKRAKITENIKKQYDSKTNLKYSLIFGMSLIIIFIVYVSF